jgi:hypothetical protein
MFPCTWSWSPTATPHPPSCSVSPTAKAPRSANARSPIFPPGPPPKWSRCAAFCAVNFFHRRHSSSKSLAPGRTDKLRRCSALSVALAWTNTSIRPLPHSATWCWPFLPARILEPCSKLATARGLQQETASSSLAETLALASLSEDDLYAAMDWLLERQPRIEKRLAAQHLEEGTVVLNDVSSTYFEGRHCPLAKLGHSRDERPGKSTNRVWLADQCTGLPGSGGGL